MAETQVEKIMRLLQCSKEEALDVIECDKRIDKGEILPFNLTKEQEKSVRKYVNSKEKTKTVYNFTKRERKKNDTKAEIIAEFADFLIKKGYENVNIANAERMITFSVGENNFDLTLIQKRQKK